MLDSAQNWKNERNRGKKNREEDPLVVFIIIFNLGAGGTAAGNYIADKTGAAAVHKC